MLGKKLFKTIGRNQNGSKTWTLSVCIAFLFAILVYIRLRIDISSISRVRSIIRLLKNGNATNYGPKLSEDNAEKTRTYRVGCREYPKGGQSCVISGIACMEVRKNRTKKDRTPLIYLVDDTRKDGAEVDNDIWCGKRYMSADPRYWGPREWPPREYFTPRQSCLEAKWRTRASLLVQDKLKVKWLEEFALVNLDFVSWDHNNHYLMDIIWLLDVILWQNTISKSSNLPRERRRYHLPELFSPPKYIVFPQTEKNFTDQTSRDVNRFNLAVVLGMNLSALYRGQKRHKQRLYTRSFLRAFPAAKKRMVFYGDERESPKNDLICTKKLIVGAKLGDMGHERVCTHFRRQSWQLFNISRPPTVSAGGYLRYHRPPRRVVFLQRHITRGVRNVKELTSALRKASVKYSFEFEFHTTDELDTAEEQVKFFSRIGVLVTPHGSHSMGGMWMPRHAAIIEFMPPGYSDFSFDMLSRACNLWYYVIRGIIPKSLKEKYRKECGNKMDTLFGQCIQMKCEAVQVPVAGTTRTVLHALRRLGHDLKIQETQTENDNMDRNLDEEKKV